MIRLFMAVFIFIVAGGAAHALGVGLGNRLGRLGISSKPAIIAPQPTGDILLVDGTSLLLQTDAASFVCRAGGC